jgi:hypothetical protein
MVMIEAARQAFNAGCTRLASVLRPGAAIQLKTAPTVPQQCALHSVAHCIPSSCLDTYIHVYKVKLHSVAVVAGTQPGHVACMYFPRHLVGVIQLQRINEGGIARNICTL